jgi:hypothetical protein
MAPPAGPGSGGLLTPSAATPTTNHDPPIEAVTGTIVLISMGAAGDLNGEETAADGSSSVAVGRTSSSTEDTVPVEAEMGLPVIPLPAIFVGDSAIDSTDGEQLIRNDLMPQSKFISISLYVY